MITASEPVAVRAPVWALVLFTGVAWGAGGLASKGLVDRGVDAFTVTGGPFLVAAVLAWAVAWRTGAIRGTALGPGLLLGAVNSALPALFFNIAYETLAAAGLVTLILSIGPLVTAGVAHRAFADERFNREKGIGLGLAFAGVAALVVAPGVIEGSSYVGAAWTLAGAVIAGATAIYARRWAVRHGAQSLIGPQLTTAGLTPILLGVLGGRALIPDGGFGAGEIAGIVAIGTVASYLGFRSIMLANQTGTTGQVSMVGYLIPIVGVAGGVVFFDEPLTLGVGIGAALILAGVTLGGRGSRPTRLARTSG